MRLRWLGFMLLFSACTSDAQQRPADLTDTLKKVEVAERVRIESPVRFWRAGKWIESKEAIVLRFDVANPAAFEPRDAPDPLFVYGRAVCEVLVHPFLGGQAVLLAPPLEGDDPPALRIVPWVPLEKVDAKAFDRVLLRRKSIAIAAPPASSAATRNYPTLERLRAEVAPKRGESPR